MTAATSVPGATATAGSPGELAAVGRGSSVNLVGALVSTLTNFGLIVVITHQLPRRDAGVFFSATSLFLLLATAAGLGTSTATVYFLPRLRLRQDSVGIHRVLRIAAWPVVIASLVSVGIMLGLPRTLGQEVTANGHHHGVDLLWVLAFALPFATLADLFQAGTRGFGRMRTTVLIEKIGRPIVQLIAVVAAAATGNLLVLCVAWGIPYIPSAMISLGSLRRLVRKVPSAGVPATEERLGRAYWGYSLPRALTGVAALALQRLDIVLVAGYKGPTDAAIYTAATRFLVVGQFLGQAILLSLQPRISALLGRHANLEAQTLYRVTTAWLICLTWPLYVSVAAFPHAFLVIFGRGYAAGSTVVIILAISMLLATSVGQVDVMISMGGRSLYNLANVTLSLAVNVGLNVILIPRDGILGAAIAWAAAIAVGNLVALVELYVILRIHPFSRSTISVSVVAALCFGLPALTRLFDANVATQLLNYGAGALLYLSWVWYDRRRLHLAELGSVSTSRYRRSR